MAVVVVLGEVGEVAFGVVGSTLAVGSTGRALDVSEHGVDPLERCHAGYLAAGVGGSGGPGVHIVDFDIGEPMVGGAVEPGPRGHLHHPCDLRPAGLAQGIDAFRHRGDSYVQPRVLA